MPTGKTTGMTSSVESSGSATTEAPVETEIEISNGTITLGNASRSIEIDSISENLPGTELAQPFDLEGSFSVNLVQEELAGKVEFAGLVQSANRGKWFGIEGLDVSFKGEMGTDAETTPLQMTATANAEVDLASDQASLSDIEFRLFDLRVNGGININSLSDAPSYAGEFRPDRIQPEIIAGRPGHGGTKNAG